MKTFAQTLGTLRAGELADELDEKLKDLVLAVDASHEKSGSITVTIKLKATKSGAIDITDTVTVKLPAPEKSTTLMFATNDGFLQRNDPAQGELDGIRSVSTDTRPMRKAT